MKIFGISDLHLSFFKPKPMEVFGLEWKQHFNKIENNWRSMVRDDDVVLIPGDISWATKYNEAIPDLTFIDNLPGKKVLLRGNHDYWWSSVSRMQKDFSNNMCFIHNYRLSYGRVSISGTRLWTYPFIKWDHLTSGFKAIENPNDVKIQKRETERLKKCIQTLPRDDNNINIIITHFPPISPDLSRNVLTDLLEEYGIDICVFGHLHTLRKEYAKTFDRVVRKVRYVLVSSDHIGFSPKLLVEI